MAHPKQLAHDSEAFFEAYEALIDDLLKSGRIDYAKFEPVADDAEAVAALVREAVGRNMLAALEIAAARLPKPEHIGDIEPAAAKNGFAKAVPYLHNTCACERHKTLRTVHVAIAQARIAGIEAEG